MARSAVATLVYAVGHQRETEEFKSALGHISERLDHKETAHTHYLLLLHGPGPLQGNPEAWDRWNRSHAAMLSEQQAPDGSFSGSYGEAYGTAMSLLSLALNYRFPPDLRTLLNPCRAVSATLPGPRSDLPRSGSGSGSVGRFLPGAGGRGGVALAKRR